MPRLTLLAPYAALLLAGCGGQPTPPISNEAANAAEAAANGASVSVLDTPVATPVAAKASAVDLKTADYTFTYKYPAQAAGFAPLATWLDQDRDGLLKALKVDTAEARKEAKSGGYDYHSYDSTTEWKTVTDTPRLLSLSADIYSYTGGAHGNPGFRSLVWDKKTVKRLDPVALFITPAELQKAVGTQFCAAIDAEREDKRGVPTKRDDDPFNGCPRVSEGTLILGSTNRQTIDRIGFLVAPYVAGPFAEGSYEVTLPVTPALLAIVKPEYRDAFAAK